jgi:DNA-binding transcriptional MocR family regulator
MNDFISIKLDKTKNIPIYQQLGDALYNFIGEGVLKPDSKLPPIRKMAEALKINNVTVINAYKYLERKRAVYSHIGSGTYVSHAHTRGEYAGRSALRVITPADSLTPESLNFAAGSVPAALFPVEDFKPYLTRVLEREAGNAFGEKSGKGYEPLRRVLCTYLEERGIKTAAEKLQIITGVQQGMELLSRASFNPGDTVIAEDPADWGGLSVLAARGARVVGVTLEPDGIDMAALEQAVKQHRPRFICVSVNFQNPTGCCYSYEKRRALLELAEKYDADIIETDTQYDLAYGDAKAQPLKAMDHRNRVVYVKSLRSLLPGLGLGFMVLPKKLNIKLTANRAPNLAAAGLTQKALELFIRDGGLDKQAARLRTLYKNRCRRMDDALTLHLKQFVVYAKPKGGLYFWLTPSTDAPPENAAAEFLNNGVLVTPGEVFTTNPGGAFRLSAAAVCGEEIEQGIKIIGRVLSESFDKF